MHRELTKAGFIFRYTGNPRDEGCSYFGLGILNWGYWSLMSFELKGESAESLPAFGGFKAQS